MIFEFLYLKELFNFSVCGRRSFEYISLKMKDIVQQPMSKVLNA